MKTILKHRDIYIPYVRILPSDIVEIVRLCSTLCNRVDVTGNGFIIEAPLEIDEYKRLTEEQFSSLNISSSTPELTIRFGAFDKRGMRIFMVEESEQFIWLVEKIKSLLEANKSRLEIFFNVILPLLSIGLGLVFLMLAIMGKEFSTSFMIIGGGLLLIFLASKLHESLAQPGAKLVVDKEEKAHFFKMHSDEIIIALIATAFGATISAILCIVLGNK